MSIFAYKARDKNGRLVAGLIDATTAENAVAVLGEKKLVVVEIDKKEAVGAQRYRLGFFKRVRLKELVSFFRQLSVMIDANLPLVRALRILARQTQSRDLKVVLSAISDEVDGGAKMSEAMANFPEVFGDFYVNMVASGETSGRLSQVMNYLADQQEKDYDLQSKVRGAMIYPAFIIVSMVVVAFLVMIFVVPQVTGLLKEAGVKLPWSTRLLIFSADSLRRFWSLLVIAVMAVVGGSMIYNKTESGSRLFDLLKIKLPIFGKVFQQVYLVRLMRGLSTLLAGGVPLNKSLETVRAVAGNKVYAEILDQANKEVAEGNPLADALSGAEPYIPLIVSQMVNIGEETGKLEEVTERIADFYSREAASKINNLSVLIEPLVMVILGIAVAIFVLAVIMPMWSLSAAM